MKKLSLFDGISVTVGLIVATSCLVSLGTGMGLAGKAFILPLFVVMILNMFIAISFAELNSIMPNVDGGTGQYLLAGLGPVPSLIGNVSAYVITMVLASTGELTMCGNVLCQLFFPGMDNRIVSLGVLAVFFVINCFGVDIFSRIQNIVVVLLIGSMIMLGLIGMLHLGTGNVVTPAMQSQPSVAGTGNVMGLAALAFWLFIGVEFVIPVAKDMKNPRRDVFLSMMLGLLLLFGVQAILGLGMTNYVNLATLAADPNGTPHMTYAMNLLGTAGKYWMGFVTILAAVSTMNTVFASTSRILQGMSEEKLMPSVLSKVNKHNAPVNGLIMMGILDAVLVISNLANTNGITFIILAASCFWLVTYCMIHATVLILRKKYPEAPRNNKLTLWGIPQIVGILGNIYMFWHIDSGASRIRIFEIFAVIFLMLVAYAFIWVCGVMKVRPFEPVDMNLVNDSASGFMDTVIASENLTSADAKAQ